MWYIFLKGAGALDGDSIKRFGDVNLICDWLFQFNSNSANVKVN